jgi:hypothetical protein
VQEGLFEVEHSVYSQDLVKFLNCRTTSFLILSAAQITPKIFHSYRYVNYLKFSYCSFQWSNIFPLHHQNAFKFRLHFSNVLCALYIHGRKFGVIKRPVPDEHHSDVSSSFTNVPIVIHNSVRVISWFSSISTLMQTAKKARLIVQRLTRTYCCV